MRILKIRIHNLNSLRGETVINFTEGPLARHQLFAIVGPTGAGKTTILDAITLALYGRSERRPKSGSHSGGFDTVMSHGAGECAAEVAFETHSGRYRANWYRARAYKKPTGALQAAQHSLSVYDLETDRFALISEKKSRTPGKVEEVIGLDYDRFIRSTMLTQGQFARFLKSDPGEKAGILEKITGMEIYNQLGKAAFDRHKIANQAYESAREQQAAIGQLTDEERSALEAERDAGERTVAGKQRELVGLEAALARRAHHTALRERLTALRASLQEAEEGLAALAPQRQSLTNSERVQHLRGALDNHVRISNRLEQLNTTLETLATHKRSAESELAIAAERATKAKRELAGFLEKLPAREATFAKAAALERSADVLEGELKLLNEQLRRYLNERERLANSFSARATSIQVINDQLSGRSADDIERQFVELEDSIAAGRAELSTLRTWLNIQRRADRIEGIKKEILALEEKISGHNQVLTEQQQALTAAEELVARRSLEHENISLKLSLSEHRQHLHNGQPCPLCGSLEHPALANGGPPTPSRLHAAKLALQKASNEYQRLDAEQTKIAEAIRSARKTKELHAGRIEEIQAEIDDTNRPGGSNDRSTTELQRVIDEAERTLAGQTEKVAGLKQLRGQLPKLRELLTVQQTEANLKKSTEQELAKLTTKVTGGQQELLHKRQQIKDLLGGTYTSDECRAKTVAEQQELETAHHATKSRLIRQTAEVDKATTRVVETREEHRTLTAELTTIAGNLNAELDALGLDLPTARLHLLTSSEEARLRGQLQSAEITASSLGSQTHQTERELELATAAVGQDDPEAMLQEQKTAFTSAIAEAQRTLGRQQQRLEEDDRRRAEFAHLSEEMVGLKKERDRWARVNDLIGSADGRKFRAYAQAITLQRLIAVGNDHLGQIAPRYQMEYEAPPLGGKEELNMVIVDLYQNDNRRTLNTLSGGETFLVSLALALGLSDLASGRANIQSLFIDEGFGTLDDKTLDKAMTTLEELQAQGKIIGLISHVPQLRERIQCQIVLEPMGDGVSKVNIVE